MNQAKLGFLGILLACALFFAPALQGEGPSLKSGPVTVELLSEYHTVQPGQPFWVAIKLSMEDGWHSYWKNPGDTGLAPSVTWELPEGFTAGDIVWPAPNRYDLQSIIGYGYENEVILLAQITPPSTISQPFNLLARLDWLVCSDMNCLPGNGAVALQLASATTASASDAQKTIHEAIASLPKDNWGVVSAERKNGLIELNFALPEGSTTIKSAYFCPNNNEQIDHTVEVIVSQEQPGSPAYSFALRDVCDREKASNLDGILVLTDGDKKHAINVSTPITDSKDSQYISMADPKKEKHSANASSSFEGGIFFYLATAFIGGLILNLMPCVLPVVSFKILSFVKLAGQARSLTIKHGLAFSLGVLVSFWVLAGVLLALKASGDAVGWGFQLQEPIFVAIMAAVIFIFSLSLFGVLEIGTVFASWVGTNAAQKGGSRENLSSSFFSGVLATAVATPCTGPFLGPAVGFAVTQPAFSAMMIFTSLGMGMALPYLVLAAFPGLLRFMPKPGNWMITFKEVTGFIMLATVLWLLWVFGAQTNHFAIFMLLAGLFFIAISCWIFGKWTTPVKKRLVRWTGTAFATMALATGGYFVYTAASPEMAGLEDVQSIATGPQHKAGQWERFSPERLAELQAQGTPVFIDFTARWCLICQANHLVLSVDEVDKKMNELGVVKMKADWTKKDAIITAELEKFGRNGVPLYVLYGANEGSQPQILPQVLTPESVIDSLSKIEKRSVALKND